MKAYAPLTGAVVFIGLVMASTPARAKPLAKEGVTFSGDDTVILSRDTYAPRYLQYFLMKYVARHADAMKYRPGSSKAGPLPEPSAASPFCGNRTRSVARTGRPCSGCQTGS